MRAFVVTRWEGASGTPQARKTPAGETGSAPEVDQQTPSPEAPADSPLVSPVLNADAARAD
ncbi:hypothetical protein [Streptomyces viridochromogenes]|uniref:hypothetical protein n=1 Tax=Streptomyces viridochromogenes TaxID=1938 RepID=UPI0001B4B623|nr:hypothetical protein [Streptomyces viridochromogenes]